MILETPSFKIWPNLPPFPICQLGKELFGDDTLLFMEIRRPWPFFKVLYSPLPRPSQLLQMRLGEAEVASAEQGTSTYFSHIQVPAHLVGYLSSSFPFQDLLTRCLTEDPSSRITAEEALAHPLFHMQPPPLPQPADLALLPSPVLHVTHDSKDGKSEEEMLAALHQC